MPSLSTVADNPLEHWEGFAGPARCYEGRKACAAAADGRRSGNRGEAGEAVKPIRETLRTRPLAYWESPMHKPRSFAVFCAVLVVAQTLTGPVRAEPPCCWAEDGHQRAGHPLEVRPHAVPTDTGHYVGYYVGGGAACRGDAPCPEEGTWGWDYGGLLLPKRVALGWYHGRRYQGGPGAYRTTGANCDSKSTP
jgi:hypothetical protein